MSRLYIFFIFSTQVSSFPHSTFGLLFYLLVIITHNNRPHHVAIYSPQLQQTRHSPTTPRPLTHKETIRQFNLYVVVKLQFYQPIAGNVKEMEKKYKALNKDETRESESNSTVLSVRKWYSKMVSQQHDMGALV